MADSKEEVRELCSYGDVKLVRKGSKYFVIRGSEERMLNVEDKTREELMWELRNKLSDLGLLGRQLGECTFKFLNVLAKDLGLEEVKEESPKKEEVKETKEEAQPKEVVEIQSQKEAPLPKEDGADDSNAEAVIEDSVKGEVVESTGVDLVVCYEEDGIKLVREVLEFYLKSEDKEVLVNPTHYDRATVKEVMIHALGRLGREGEKLMKLADSFTDAFLRCVFSLPKVRTLEELENLLGLGRQVLFKHSTLFEDVCGVAGDASEIKKCWGKLKVEDRIPILYDFWEVVVGDVVKPVLVKSSLRDEPELYLAYKGLLHNPTKLFEKFFVYALGGRSSQMFNAFKAYVIGKAKEEVWEAEISPIRYLPLKSKVIDLETLEVKNYEDLNVYFRYTLDYDIDYGLFEKLVKGEVGEEVFQQYNFYTNLLRRFYSDEKGGDNVNEVNEKSEDRVSEYERIKDVLGALLAPVSLKLLAIVKGVPNTGKDTLDYLITKAMKRMVVHTSLEQITSDYTFKEESLIGKRVIITSEKPETIVRNVEILKRITGGSILHAERKNKAAVEIEDNILKVVVFANELPTFSRIEDALLDRLMIVKASNPLKEDEKDPMFKEKLEGEIPAFMTFMLYCYKQLRDRGFKLRKQKNEELSEMLLETYFRDIEAWASEEVIYDPSLRTLRKEAYDSYAAWCIKKGKKPIGRNSFYERFRLLLQRKYGITQVEVEDRYFMCGLRQKAEENKEGLEKYL